MSNLSKLPRALISKISDDPRVIRYFESMQAQVVDLMPEQIKSILANISYAVLTAEQAQGMALQALNKPDNSPLTLLPAVTSTDAPIGLVVPMVSIDSALPLLPAL